MANELLFEWSGSLYSEPFSAVPDVTFGSSSGSEFFPSPPPTTSFATQPTLSYPVKGLRMPHGVTSRAYFVARIPEAVALATGLTFEMMYVVAPNPFNADVSGTKVYMEVAGAALLSGTSLLDDSCFAAGNNTPIAGQSGALPTKAGAVYLHTSSVTSGWAIAKAGLVASDNSTAIAAGGSAIFRFSRIGGNALDTNLGDIIVVNVAVRNT